MEGKIGEGIANRMREAIRTDGTFCGTDEWLQTHGFTRDDFEAFLECGVLYARMNDQRQMGMNPDASTAILTFTTHSGKVGQDEEKWTCMSPRKFTDSILRVAEHGPVMVSMFPADLTPSGQMSFDWDDETGEILE
jgi:hypothetical protein